MAEPIRIVDGRTSSNEGAHTEGNSLLVIEGGVDGLNKYYADASFKAADSPATHDFYTDTDRIARNGWVINDGSGSIQVDFSKDGITYGDKWTMNAYETVQLKGLRIKKIRITHTGADSSYRIFLI